MQPGRYLCSLYPVALFLELFLRAGVFRQPALPVVLTQRHVLWNLLEERTLFMKCIIILSSFWSCLWHRHHHLSPPGKKALSGMGFHYCCCQNYSLFVISALAVDRVRSPLDLWILYAVRYHVAMENAGFLPVDIGMISSISAKRPHIVISVMSWPEREVNKTKFTGSVLLLPMSVRRTKQLFGRNALEPLLY